VQVDANLKDLPLYVNPDKSGLSFVCQKVINRLYAVVIINIIFIKNLTSFKYSLF